VHPACDVSQRVHTVGLLTNTTLAPRAQPAPDNVLMLMREKRIDGNAGSNSSTMSFVRYSPLPPELFEFRCFHVCQIRNLGSEPYLVGT